jgi:hypothetical protein
MEVKRLVGKRVRVLLAQCNQTTDIKTAVGVSVHEAGGRLLLRLDDGTDMPIELGWVISITEVQRACCLFLSAFFRYAYCGYVSGGCAGV